MSTAVSTGSQRTSAPAAAPVPRWVDAATLLSLFALHGVMLVRAAAFSAVPMEDAAILFRYAEHVALGEGIVWNVGENPVDGATDFLYMMAIAALHSMGVGLLAAARALDLVGTAGTMLLVYVVGRRLFGQPPWVSAIGPGLVALGPASVYTSMGFGAPFYGLTVTVTGVACLSFVRRPTTGRAVVLGLACLVMGLVRPEGVILAALLAIGLLIVRPGRARELVAGLAVGLGLPGLVYFLWRWAYFGHPLPNPYYKKGSGALHIDGLLGSVTAARHWLVPLSLLLLAALLSARSRRYALALAVPVVGYLLMWVLLSSEMNHFRRFQYPVLVLFALSTSALWSMRGSFPSRWSRRPAALVALAAVNAALLVYYVSAYEPVSDSRGPLGTALREHADRGQLLATTEAGLVPLNSGWRTLDLWGLNDQHIAHHGLTPALLRKADPAVVFVHGDLDRRARSGPESRVRSGPLQGWQEMLNTVQRFMADDGRYRLVASFGDPQDPYAVYVSTAAPNFADLAAAACAGLAADPTGRCTGRP